MKLLKRLNGAFLALFLTSAFSINYVSANPTEAILEQINENEVESVGPGMYLDPIGMEEVLNPEPDMASPGYYLDPLNLDSPSGTIEENAQKRDVYVTFRLSRNEEPIPFLKGHYHLKLRGDQGTTYHDDIDGDIVANQQVVTYIIRDVPDVNLEIKLVDVYLKMEDNPNTTVWIKSSGNKPITINKGELTTYVVITLNDYTSEVRPK